MFILFLVLHIIVVLTITPHALLAAHRGAAGLAPENTLAAIQAGLDAGATYIEVDVQRSADGVLLLMHDSDLSRTTDGSGLVHETSWEVISRLDAGSSFSAEYAGEPVPSFAAVLEFTAQHAFTLVLEIKFPESSTGIEANIVAAIQAHGLEGQVIIESFDYASLQRANQLDSDISLLLLSQYPSSVPHIQDGQIVGVFWLSVLADPTLTFRLHQNGYKVWVYTVNSSFLIGLLDRLAVDGVFTDRPDLRSD
jgi:glycerophosphoryl diester phosphodiesterase